LATGTKVQNFELSKLQFARLQQGGQKEFRLVYDAYYTLINYVVQRCGLSDSDRADVVQDTFIALYTKAQQIHSAEKIKPWLVVTARNRCLDRLRFLKRQKEDHMHDIENQPENYQSSEQQIEQLHYELQVNLVGELLRHCINDGDDDCAEMFYLQGMKAKDIANFKNEPISTITNRLSRFRKKFRDKFKRQLEM